MCRTVHNHGVIRERTALVLVNSCTPWCLRVSVKDVLHAYCSGTIFGQPSGDAPFSVLALHGWRRDLHDFQALFDGGLPGNLSGLAVDLPGFGASAPPPTAWGSAEYAEALLELFDLMIERPVLLGHSFGGRVALQFAALYPDRIGGLVLTGVPLIANASQSRSRGSYRVIRALADRRLVSQDRLERARKRYGSADYRAAEGVMREVLIRSVNERYEQLMPKVRTHVELVWGDQDTATPIELERKALELFPDANLKVLEHCGHMLPLEASFELSMAVERCLN